MPERDQGSSQPLLEVSHVSRAFPGVQALDDVSFELRAGEVHALAGENGAGKSTLVQLLSGLLVPDRGEIRINGSVVRLSDPVTARRHGIVTVYQEADLCEPLSIAENMAWLHGLPTNRLGMIRWSKVLKEARAELAELREPIDPRRPADQLTVAQRHVVQIAAATTRLARVVLLDEPTSALSSEESAWLFEQIERLRGEGVGVLYISHRHEELFRLADRITVLRDGRVVWTGSSRAIDPAGLVRAMVDRPEPLRSPSSPRAAARSSVAVPLLRSVEVRDRQGRVAGVNLDVFGGEVLGIYGLVGSGRSEWAQCLFGLRPCLGGSIEIDGIPRRVDSPPRARALGLAYLPEDRLSQGIFPGLNVRSNLVLAALRSLSRHGVAWSPDETRAARLQVDALGVRCRGLEQPICELSGGNQQKVVLGRWLLTRPRVLLLDEPTRGVDVAAKAEIHRLIRAQAEAGAGVVLISSELTEVLAQSDRIAVFREGRVAGVWPAGAVSAEGVATAALPGVDSRSELGGGRATRPGSSQTPVWLALSIVLLFATLALTTKGRFVSPDNLLNVLGNSAQLAVMALGASVVLIAGGIDISIGSILGLTAATAGVLLGTSIGVAAAVVIGLSVGVACGALNAAVSLVGRVHPIVVTLGALTVYRGLLIALTGGETVNELPESFRELALGRVAGLPGAVVIAAVVALVGTVWSRRFRSGRAVFVLGSNVVAAKRMGVRRARVWLTAYGVGGLCAGLAGLIELAQNGSMQSTLGTGAELRAITAAVIGGVAVTGGQGTVVGVVLGALLLALVQNSLVLWQVSRYHYDLVIGGLLLLAIGLDRVSRRLAR